MQSGNRFFSLPLFRKNVLRYCPLWGLLFLVLVIRLPAYFLNVNPETIGEPLAVFFHNQVVEFSMDPWMTFFFGILAAMALWSYLYTSRAVGMFHALPLRRETIFITNYLTGLVFFLVPSLAALLLGLLAQALLGALAVKALFFWFLCQNLMMVCFFSIATLVAFVVGSTPALPVIYVIFNSLFLVLSSLISGILRSFLYGYYDSPILSWIGETLCPIYAMYQQKQFRYLPNYWESWQQYTVLDMPSVKVLVVYALVGIVFAALALLLYRRRKLEMAGEVIAVPWLRPVFKYGAAFCGAITFGDMFYQSLIGGMEDQGIDVLLVCLCLFGAITYFAAAMIMKKSFRVWRSQWKGCVVLLAVLLLGGFSLELDLFGYQQRVPAIANVERVELEGSEFYLQNPKLGEDEEFIQNVWDFHHAIVAEKKQTLAFLRDWHYSNYDSDMSVSYVTIRYHLENGSVLNRAYSVPITLQGLEQENSSVALYYQLVNRQEWLLENNMPMEADREKLYQASLSQDSRILIEQEIGNSEQWQGGQVFFSRDEAQRLYDAVVEDMEAGRLGQKFLLPGQYEKYTLANTLTLYFQTEEEPRLVDITLLTTGTETLAVLEELGYVMGEDLLTLEQIFKIEELYYGAGYGEKLFIPSVSVSVYSEEPAFPLPVLP